MKKNKKINKQDLIAQVQVHCDLSFKKSAEIVTNILDFIKSELEKGHSVQLQNIGTLITHKKGRRNVVFRERKYEVPPRIYTSFKPSTNLHPNVEKATEIVGTTAYDEEMTKRKLKDVQANLKSKK